MMILLAGTIQLAGGMISLLAATWYYSHENKTEERGASPEYLSTALHHEHKGIGECWTMGWGWLITCTASTLSIIGAFFILCGGGTTPEIEAYNRKIEAEIGLGYCGDDDWMAGGIIKKMFPSEGEIVADAQRPRCLGNFKRLSGSSEDGCVKYKLVEDFDSNMRCTKTSQFKAKEARDNLRQERINSNNEKNVDFIEPMNSTFLQVPDESYAKRLEVDYDTNENRLFNLDNHSHIKRKCSEPKKILPKKPNLVKRPHSSIGVSYNQNLTEKIKLTNQPKSTIDKSKPAKLAVEFMTAPSDGNLNLETSQVMPLRSDVIYLSKKIFNRELAT